MQMSIWLFLHGLVFLAGLDDVADDGLVGPIDQPPKCISIWLLLLFFDELDLQVHEMNLL